MKTNTLLNVDKSSRVTTINKNFKKQNKPPNHKKAPTYAGAWGVVLLGDNTLPAYHQSVDVPFSLFVLIPRTSDSPESKWLLANP
jgi:hypothetical protein